MKLDTEKMIATKEGAVVWMVFNNPARHTAIGLEMWQAIPAIMEGFARDPEVRVIVLKGAGEKAFAAGADISQFEHNRDTQKAVEAYNAATARASRAICEVRKPTIAMVRGYCVGGGCGIALCCDLRVAAEGSEFGIPAAKLGIGYGHEGLARLMHLVGPAYAKEIFFTARRYPAGDALRMGLVNRVVPADGLEAYVVDLAETIGTNAPLSVTAVKITVDELVKDPGERDMDVSRAAVEACFASEDYLEGRTAFMEKRRPRFQGR